MLPALDTEQDGGHLRLSVRVSARKDCSSLGDGRLVGELVELFTALHLAFRFDNIGESGLEEKAPCD